MKRKKIDTPIKSPVPQKKHKQEKEASTSVKEPYFPLTQYFDTSKTSTIEKGNVRRILLEPDFPSFDELIQIFAGMEIRHRKKSNSI